MRFILAINIFICVLFFNGCTSSKDISKNEHFDKYIGKTFEIDKPSWLLLGAVDIYNIAPNELDYNNSTRFDTSEVNVDLPSGYICKKVLRLNPNESNFTVKKFYETNNSESGFTNIYVFGTLTLNNKDYPVSISCSNTKFSTSGSSTIVAIPWESETWIYKNNE